MASFQYFEHLADVQMLAMLSCILSESSLANYGRLNHDTNDYQFGSQDQKRASNRLSQQAGGSSNYYPTLEVARNLLRPPLPKGSDPEKRASGPQSTSSSVGATISESLTPYSTGATPPNIHRPTFMSFERHDSQISSTSASHEHQRNTHRSNSNLASTFAASFSRPFSFNTSISSSPPTTYLKKRLSPAGSYTGAPPTGANWGATSFFAKQSTITEDPRSVYSLSVSDTEEDVVVSKPEVFTTKLKNQDQFDNEGYTSIPLLDPDHIGRYQSYRESYAHMLFAWGMPLARCEILKYNEHSSPTTSALGNSPNLFAVGESNIDFPNADKEKGPRLGFLLDGKSFSSKNIQRHEDTTPAFLMSSNSPLICLLCAEVIRGLCSPCLACGHVLHASCRLIISPQTNEATEGGECISGCGCRCPDHAIIEVRPYSQDQVGPSPTAVINMANKREQYEWRGEDEKYENPWEDMPREDVAYESLARVRERYITPKPSQIWRGA